MRVIRVIEETRIQNHDSRHDDSVIRSNVEEYNFKYNKSAKLISVEFIIL